MKVGKKDTQRAARLAAASIRATMQGIVEGGSMEIGLIRALAGLAAEMDRRVGGNTQPIDFFNMVVQEGEKP